MKKRAISAFLVLLSVFLILTGCAPSDPGITLSPTQPTGESPASDLVLTQDFDPETNQLVWFRDIEFQIPNTWYISGEEDYVTYLIGREDSQLGPISLELLAEGTTEEDLAGEECQQAVITAYSDLLLNLFFDLECTDAFYDDAFELFSVKFEGTISGKHAAFTLYAFVEADGLYVLSLPFMEGDPFDYTLDIANVLASVTSSQFYNPDFELDEGFDLPEGSTFSIHFIDVGQADAALVECDGQYMLIDGGNKADANLIYSVLEKAKVPYLTLVVGTHAHEDHIGGLPGAYQYCQADITLCPVTSYDSKAFRDFARYAEEKGGGITVPSVGDFYQLGSAAVKILGVNGGEDTNDTSIVLMIYYGETSFLFTGDAEREAEQASLNSGADLSATVLKVGHHGANTSTSYLFLREILPQYAVISVGEGNTYGHPTEDALSRLRDAGVTVFRTDMQGDIYCTSDGRTVTFTVSRNANADTFVDIQD